MPEQGIARDDVYVCVCVLQLFAAPAKRAESAASRPAMASQDPDFVDSAGSDAETESSITIVAENLDVQGNILGKMSELMDLKTVAVSWEIQITEHQYNRAFKRDLSELICDITLLYSSFEAISNAIAEGRATSYDEQVFEGRLEEIRVQWFVLHGVANQLIQNAEDDSNSDVQEVGPSAKRSRQ
jgi:hypothetical protein